MTRGIHPAVHQAKHPPVVYSCGLLLLALFSGTHDVAVVARDGGTVGFACQVLLPASLPSKLAAIVQHATAANPAYRVGFSGLSESLDAAFKVMLASDGRTIGDAARRISYFIAAETDAATGNSAETTVTLYAGRLQVFGS